MSKRDIDPRTGLPLLPEGYRWNIYKEMGWPEGLYGSYRVETGHFAIFIQHESEYVTHRAKKRWWKADLPEVTETTWKAVTGTSVTLAAKTKEAALEAAFKSLDAFETYEAEQALLGTYPPKTLG